MNQTNIRKKLVTISLMDENNGEEILKKVNELIELMDG
jgi:hypothetical protein